MIRLLFTRGTNCVGKALEISKRLNGLAEKVEAHVIVESKGLNEPAIHAAVAVPCRDGILLIDINRDVPIMILKLKQTF